MTLTEFLLARFDEDEAWARNPEFDWGDPERALAEVEAKRRIAWRHGADTPGRFTQHDPCRWAFIGLDGGEPCGTLKELAAPYAGHPDFYEEWRK